MNAILYRVEPRPGYPDRGVLMFDCPACRCCHSFNTIQADPPQPTWSWNGDMEKPTFSPSLLVTGTQPITDDEHRRIMAGEKITPRPLRCHSFVRNGNIEYCSDSLHEYAGKTVPLQPF